MCDDKSNLLVVKTDPELRLGALRSPSNVGEVVVVVVGEAQPEEAADRIAVRGLRVGVLSAFLLHVVLEGVALGLLQEGDTCSKNSEGPLTLVHVFGAW